MSSTILDYLLPVLSPAAIPPLRANASGRVSARDLAGRLPSTGGTTTVMPVADAQEQLAAIGLDVPGGLAPVSAGGDCVD